MAVVKRPKKKQGKVIGHYYSVVLYDHNGKQKWTGRFDRKADALAEEVKLKRELQTGGAIAPQKETLGEFLDRWLKRYGKENLRRRTYEGYETIVEKHIKPRLGGIALAKLQPAHLDEYFAEKREKGRLDGDGGLSGEYLRQHYAVLHKALQWGLKKGAVSRNVADLVDRPVVAKKEAQALNQEQATALMKAAADTLLYPIILLALATGMRRGEILGLRWQDVDMKKGLVRVRQTIEVVKKADGEEGYSIEFGQPKNETSRRTIAIPQDTVDGLKRWRTRQKELRFKSGPLFRDRDLICSRFDGSPLDPREISKQVTGLMKKQGLPGSLHTLRHTHASYLIGKNIHLKKISGRLGHSQISTTADIYGHLEPEMDTEAAEAISSLFENKKEKPGG